MFIAVQFSIPLSLGLLGSLSIVRFRVPIKEAEEVAFLMLLVASAVVCGTFQFQLLFALLGISMLLLTLQRLLPWLTRSRRFNGSVLLTYSPGLESGSQQEVMALLGKHLPRGRLQSLVDLEEQQTLCYSFPHLGQETIHQLQSALRKVSPTIRTSFTFNQDGQLPT